MVDIPESHSGPNVDDPRFIWQVNACHKTKTSSGKRRLTVSLFIKHENGEVSLYRGADLERPDAGDLDDEAAQELEEKIRRSKKNIARLFLLCEKYGNPWS